jgi:2-methylisocitrate lyase-like PEP mutase family enzyme
LIVARTDAVAVEGFAQAIERAKLYAKAGADVLFVEAPRTREQLSAVADALGSMRTPIVGAQELETMGYSLVIFPGAIVRAIAHTAKEFYSTLAGDGTSGAFRHRMFDFDALNALIGTPQMMEEGKRYAGDAPAPRQIDVA